MLHQSNLLAPLAQFSLGPDGWVGIGVIALLAFLVSLSLVVVARYKRCPPNRILVIFGRVKRGDSARCLHGGGAFVWPLIQNYSYLDLDPIQIEVPLQDALSAENIRVNVPSFFTVAIGTDPATMQNAAVRLNGLKTEEVKGQALDIIFGQLRQVIASMTIEAINRDRDVFLQSIQQNLEPELEKVGLVLINVNITDITDASGYIEALGRKAASEAIQQAEIDVAEQVKKGAIGVSAADRDREIEVSQAVKLKEIGVKDAEREMAVRVAELAKDRSVGERTAEFERDVMIKDAERTKRVEMAKADANAVTGENQSREQIADSEAKLKIATAEAYQAGETRHREAEAAVLAAQYTAEAKAAEQKALKIEAEQRAQIEAPARAAKARTIVDSEAEAEKLKIEAAGRAAAKVLEAEGEAKAIFAKLEAQARGEFEILAKKGEGLRSIVAGCGGPEEAFQLMMLEHLDHLAETSAEAISNIKFDKITVWDSGSKDGNGGAAGFLSSLGQSVPPLMDVMQRVGGVEMPSYFGRMIRPEEEQSQPATAAAVPAEEESSEASTEAAKAPEAAKAAPSPAPKSAPKPTPGGEGKPGQASGGKG